MRQTNGAPAGNDGRDDVLTVVAIAIVVARGWGVRAKG